MTWILANPLLSAAILLAALLGVVCGVQSARIKSLKADVLLAQAENTKVRADLNAQSTLVRAWAKQAQDARDRADHEMAKANILREQRDGVALKLHKMRLPADECQALAALVDAAK